MKPNCVSPSFTGAAFVVALLFFSLAPAVRAGTDLGIFEAETDVGTVIPAGSTQFDKDTGQYHIKSSGQNIWKTHDDFHFVYMKVTGDLVLTADVSWDGVGKNAHRKAGWMIRQGLEPDAAYADVMVHGDGHIALQYRTKQGDITSDTKSTITAPALVRLERHGETISLYVAAKSDKAPAFELAGSIKIALQDPVYAGLAVSSHDPMITETAVISGVALKHETAPPGKDQGK